MEHIHLVRIIFTFSTSSLSNTITSFSNNTLLNKWHHQKELPHTLLITGIAFSRTNEGGRKITFQGNAYLFSIQKIDTTPNSFFLLPTAPYYYFYKWQGPLLIAEIHSFNSLFFCHAEKIHNHT